MNFSDKLRTLKQHPRMVLAITILLSSCLVYYQYVFGNSIFIFNDIGADTQQQYIMQFNSIVNHIRDGNLSVWDFTNGFGTSMLQLNLFDPSLMILYLAGVIFGPALMPYLLIYLHIGKMILAGIACYQFLTCFSFSDKAKLLASYLYAFNGFLIVWGQHYQFSMIAVYLPLFLYLLEKSLHRDRFSPSISLITTCIIIYSYYTGYMTMLTGGIYLIIRLFFMEDLLWKTRYRRFFRGCASMILGVCMGLFSLLPAFALVTNVSSRLESNMGFWGKIWTSIAPYPLRYYFTLLFRFFSSNLEGIGNDTIHMPYRGYSNFYEDPNVFFSTLFVILLVQYLFYLARSKECTRKKVTQWTLILLSAVALLLMAGSLVFNGFSAPFSRHTFVLMPVFALLVANMTDVIFDRRYFSITGGILTLICATILYGFSYRKTALTPSVKLNVLLLWGSTLLMICLLYMAAHRNPVRSYSTSAVFALLACVTAVNVLSDSHITARGRSSVEKGDPNYFNYLYSPDMDNLLRYVEDTDPEFCRIEKTFAQASWSMESCAQDYRGIGTYNSTLNRNLIQFTEKMIPNLNLYNFARTTYRHIAHDDAFATLFGIRYLVTTDENYSSDAYRLLRQFGSLYLYQNQYDASVGRLYQNTLDKSTFEANPGAYDLSGLISQAVVTDEPDNLTMSAEELASYVKQPLPDYTRYNASELTDHINPESHAVSFVDGVTIPLDPALQEEKAPVTMNFNITAIRPPALTFITNNGITDTGRIELTKFDVQPTYTYTLTIPEDTTSIRCESRYQGIAHTLTDISFMAQSAASDFPEDSGVTINNTGNDSHLSGKIHAGSYSLAFLAIPFEKGWHATVDGKPVELVRTDYGFTGFYVQAGEHEFTLNYQAPLLREGIILSAVSLGIFLAITFLTKKDEH